MISERYASTATPGGYGFVEYLPAGYAQSGNWPLVVFMHGMGERGDGSAGQLPRVRNQGPLRQIETNKKDYPFVLIAPQTGVNSFWNDFEAQYNIQPFVQHLIKTYKIDPKRVYLTGLSLGGSGVFSVLNVFPETFAGAIAICGGAFNATQTGADRIVNAGVGLWSFYSTDDGVSNTATPAWMNVLGRSLGATRVPTDTMPAGEPWTGHVNAADAWEWVNRVSDTNAAGAAPPYPLLNTVWRTRGHFIWDSVYENDAVWTWLLRQKKP